MLKLQTMKLCLAFILILLCGMAQAQTNYLFGNLSSFSQLSRSNVVMTLQNITPKKRTVNNVLISDDPITNSTDVLGNFGFTNVIYAKYSLTAGDSQITTWILYVGTNTLGNVPIASLITNSAAVPPNSGANYYTIAQINALLAGITGGGSASLTNTVFGFQTDLSDSTNKLQIHYLYTNGMPWYSVLTTNQ